jgi:protein ImuB
MYACIYIPDLPSHCHSALVQCAESFSPVFEPGPNRVVLDIRGLGTLMGNLREIAARMTANLEAASLAGNVAIAANPHAAIASARGISGITIIVPGDEARALSRLPLTLLDPDPELFDTLTSWGVHTFGDLSRLPEIGLAERLGQEGVRLYMLARGLSPGPLVTEREAPSFESAMDLDHPLDSLEPLAFLLGRLLNEICGNLIRHGLAATEISVHLALEDRSEHRRTVRLPYASTDHSTLLKLLQYDLAAHPPQASIVKVRVHIQPAPQRRLQGGLFVPVAPEAEKLELTLARLAAVVGEGNVGSPELLPTHKPDSFRLNRFTARPDRGLIDRPVCSDPPLAIRLFRPPIPAEVVAPLGYPQRITSREIGGRVVGYAGPWRISGDWWRADAWARDDWDVALDSGCLYRVCREASRNETAKSRWFISGNYD